MDCVLAIDQGTHATRTVLFDTRGTAISHHELPIDLYPLSATNIELAPEQVLNSVTAAITEAVNAAPGPIRCAGMAVQRSTLVAWNKSTGEPLAPGISWQDTRSSPLMDRMHLHQRLIHQVSGLPLSSHYLAGKMRWLLEENDDVVEACHSNNLLLGPLASFLAFNLLDGQPAIIDSSNAARSMLFNLEHRQWSKALLEIFHIQRNSLPDCVPTLAEHGIIAGTGIPLTCLCGDQNAAIHAHGTPPDDQLQLNLGSGAFILKTSGATVIHHPTLISGIAWNNSDTCRYLLEGSVNGVGNAIRWLQEQTLEDIQEKLPAWLEDVHTPPLFLNTLGGLGSPYWNNQIEARFIPETQSIPRRAVALVESIAFLIQRNLEEMDCSGIQGIQASGGVSRINGLCQYIADLSGFTVHRHEDPEATARGVAWLAAGQPATWETPTTGRTFQPGSNPGLRSRYQQFLKYLDVELKAHSRPDLRALTS